MTYQTTLSDADRAILSRLALPALRNASRMDDSTDYRTMLTLAKQRHNGPLKDVYPEWRAFAMLTFAQGDLP